MGEKIEEQVQAVGEALRHAEDELVQNLGAQQKAGAYAAKWREVRKQRDEALNCLDREAMAGCRSHNKDTDADKDTEKGPAGAGKQHDAIDELVSAIKILDAQHQAMQELETQMAASQDVQKQLRRLRRQRVQRPRILLSKSVSNRTGQGLCDLRHELSALMADQRLFPHVGQKVPLNYSMLERLAQEGREGSEANTIPFEWVSFCKRAPVTGFEVVLCDPERADSDLCNATQLVGKMAVAKPGGCSFTQKAQRVLEAGALGLVIVNSRDTLVFEEEEEQESAIPVVMIRSSDADALVASGNSSALRHKDQDRRTEWEQTVTKHAADKATAELRAVCGQAFVSLHALAAAAAEVGMDKDEVLSALRFLHGIGSVLHYAVGTRRGGPDLHGTVFMQPQEIINGFKYVIREPGEVDINDELREMDIRIRSSGDGEALEQFLGSEASLASGVLTKRLLMRHLWRDLAPGNREVLLQLMKAFKLIRPLADADTFLVPAMLPQRELPREYVMPHWWCPSKASGAAAVHVQDPARRAEMRIEYTAQGCSLPFGFFNELQVRLSTSDSVDTDAGLHFAPDAAVVDRIAGSVLSEAYACGEGTVREWAIVSRPWARGIAGKEQKSIRVMGWAELSSSAGATDWRLFKRVMREIEEMRMSAPGLELQIAVWYLNAHGKAATWKAPTSRLLTKQIISFKLVDGAEDVPRNFVIPDLESDSVSQLMKADTELASAHAQSVQQVTLAADKAHRIDAFFAKKVDDHLIDVHSEGQKMMRIVMNPGCGWECNVNPQPTLDDLSTSIFLARERNLRVLHLAGHGKRMCGFIWNRDDAATGSREFDLDAIALAIGAVARPHGPIECVVLNACSTHAMGQKLLQRGVPCVLCWTTPVQDETARERCEHFFRALVEDASGARDYKRAFFAATNALRRGSCTDGAAHLPRGEEAMDDRHLLRHRSSVTRNPNEDADERLEVDEMAALPLGMGESSRGGPGRPWNQEDVVQFLSQDGDSDPIYLWRERREVSAPCAAQPPPAATSLDAALSSLFEQHGLGAICADVCKELGVDNCGDLGHVAQEDLNTLPKYVKDKIKPVHRRKLEQLIEIQQRAARAQPSAAGVGGGGGATTPAESASDAGAGTSIRTATVTKQAALMTAPLSKPENVSRCTRFEIAGLWRAANDSIKRSETLVAHFTSLDAAKLILGEFSLGLRASTMGQAGGGISVVFSDSQDGPLAELNWDKWQGGEFRATTGKQLWGEKWESVRVGGSDEGKLDVVFFIAVPTVWVDNAAKVEGRPLIRIIPSLLLTEHQGHHWLQKGKIVKIYILRRDEEIVME